MENLILTKSQARRFILAYQGLWPPRALKGKAGILDYIHRVGCIQFDPLKIVGNNPELVLQARVSEFQPDLLDSLLYEDRKLVDGWDKNMSIYPVEDWPYFQRRRDADRVRLGKRLEATRDILPQVRAELEARGPLSSIDLDFDKTVDWSWAPTRAARAALDSMYTWGELIVHHKVHTRKVYDFAHKHISSAYLDAADPNETETQYQDWYVFRRIGSVGLIWDRAGGAWLNMPGLKSKERKATLSRLLAQEKILQVQIGDINAPCYMQCEAIPLLDDVIHTNANAPQAAILAPLDNLIWDRKFVKALFGFSYVWEVYKPVAERQYGYYVLPILYGDRFVARFEPGRDKESGALLIKQWWWEPDVTPSDDTRRALRHCFEDFLHYLDTDQLQVEPKAAHQADLTWLP